MNNTVLRHILIDSINLSEAKKKSYAFINPFSYYKLRSQEILKHFDGVFVDGISLVICCRIVRILIKRKSFDMTSLGKEVLSFCDQNQKKIYFIGAKEREIRSFVGTIKSEFKDLIVSGSRNGYFASCQEEEKEIKKIVSEVKPDVVVVGMGSPLQEKFLIKLMKEGFEGVSFTCGGFIHQTSSKINYYPSWINKFNIRWAYRIIDEPKLLKRYLFYYPKGLAMFLLDVLKK
jgi:N-acetylglucosaminyldiphosphoundecaprenol N-acetyl-beta-D-mannosaminyltransferase